jgi:type II secretory pathway component PulM
LAFAAAKAGRSIAAKMAMMAITTRSSINVKAAWLRRMTREKKTLLNVWLFITLILLFLCIGRDDKATPANDPTTP